MPWFVICVLVVVSIVLLCVAFRKREQKDTAFRGESQKGKQIDAEPEIVTFHAEVIDMTCGTYTIGTKIPKMVKYFTVRFKKDDGELFDLNVPEEYYDGFEAGLSGNLCLVDGKLNSFVPDGEQIDLI